MQSSELSKRLNALAGIHGKTIIEATADRLRARSPIYRTAKDSTALLIHNVIVESVIRRHESCRGKTVHVVEQQIESGELLLIRSRGNFKIVKAR